LKEYIKESYKDVEPVQKYMIAAEKAAEEGD
jgi:hypothetical protein